MQVSNIRFYLQNSSSKIRQTRTFNLRLHPYLTWLRILEYCQDAGKICLIFLNIGSLWPRNTICQVYTIYRYTHPKSHPVAKRWQKKSSSLVLIAVTLKLIFWVRCMQITQFLPQNKTQIEGPFTNS